MRPPALCEQLHVSELFAFVSVESPCKHKRLLRLGPEQRAFSTVHDGAFPRQSKAAGSSQATYPYFEVVSGDEPSFKV